MCRLLLLVLLLSACSTGKVEKPSPQWKPSPQPTKAIDYSDACSIYANQPEWLFDSLESSRRWQVPVFIFLAFMYQESSFNPEARPRNARGELLSSAYGYAQALDGTWLEYQEESGNTNGKRNRFNDAVDFIGWYVLRVHRATGISKWDAANLYLNYHEGIGGYKRGLHNKKPWLLKVADKVNKRAASYHKQLLSCRIPIYLEKDGSVPARYKKHSVPDRPLAKKIIWF